MQLTRIHQLAGRIELLSGLRIGGGNDEMHIGGIDNPVIKHPYTLEPYLPGSSLKGKMRSLLEWRAGIVSHCQGRPVSAKALKDIADAQKPQAEAILKLFGMAGDANDDKLAEQIGPSRLAFWDCGLAQSSREQIRDGNFLFTEAKSENTINRISGVAEHPRQMERVPAGVCFDFRLNLRVLDGDGGLLETVLDGLKLLELDSLGGSGSRGYGKIAFRDMTLDGECIAAKLGNRDPFKILPQAA